MPEVNVQPAEAKSGDTPEYVQEMVDKAEGNTEPTANEKVDQNPDSPLYAGKYKSVDELEKAYKELETKLGSTDGEQTEEEDSDNAVNDSEEEDPKQEEPEEEQEVDSDEEAAKETLENKGLDYNKYEQEWAEKGEISEDSYKELEKMGIPRDLVDSYIEGQQLKGEVFKKEVYDLCGGEEDFVAMQEWANSSLSEAEIDAYNEELQSGNKTKVMLAVKGLYAQYRAENGTPAKLLDPDTSSDSPISGYTSWDDLKADMAKPEYKTNDSFRKQVQERLARSKF